MSFPKNSGSGVRRAPAPRAILALLLLVLVSAVLFSCGQKPVTDPRLPELKEDTHLEFALSADRRSYEVVGFGSSTSQRIRIPSTYNGKPVTAIAQPGFFCENGSRQATQLLRVDIPATVTRIDRGVFNGCLSLEFLRVDENNPVYRNAGDCIIEKETGTVIAGTNGSTIPADGTVTAIAPDAFNGRMTLSKVTIPKTVTSVGAFAFANCRGLTTMEVQKGNSVYYAEGNCLIESAGKVLVAGCGASVIPKGVKVIAPNAFYRCEGLEEAVIPEGVTEIGDRAFFGATGLKTVRIPASVTRIGVSCFEGCENAFADEDGVRYVDTWAIGRAESEDEDEDEEITSSPILRIRAGTLGIADSAFSAAFGVREVVLPESLAVIGERAFFVCPVLKKITIPASVTRIGAQAFSNCGSLKEVYCGAAGPGADWSEDWLAGATPTVQWNAH